MTLLLELLLLLLGENWAVHGLLVLQPFAVPQQLWRRQATAGTGPDRHGCQQGRRLLRVWHGVHALHLRRSILLWLMMSHVLLRVLVVMHVRGRSQ